MYLTENEVRIQENFDLGWFFFHGEGERTPGETDTREYRPVTLPHDWSLEYPFDEQAASCGSGGYAETGIGWYRKCFRVDPKAVQTGRVILRFDGAYMCTSVWVNGSSLGHHVYGYTPFEWNITPFLLTDGGENVVDVRVDNSAQPNSRWYSGSGITRDVWLIRVQDVHVAPYGVWIQQPLVTQEEARLFAETQLCDESCGCRGKKEVKQLEVETSVYGPDGSLRARSVTACGQERSVRQELKIEKPLLWDIRNPVLYQVITKVYADGALQDEVTTPIGLRSAVFDRDKGFLLNGNRVKLNGVCVHHDGGCVGAAVHPRIWERRLLRLKEMGVNAVRMSHNPPDPALLDLCDRLGLLVMDEAFDEWRILKGKELGSNTHASRGYSEWFDSCHEEDIRSMLRRDRNHPSVVIWSIGNEVPDQTDPLGHLTARHLKGICRQMDPERAVTQANDQICAEPRAAREEFLDELDVVGYNYVGRWRTRAETLYDDDRRAHPEWCMIGTENGGLGGIRSKYLLGLEEKAGWWKRPYYSAPVEVGRLLRYTMTHDYVAGDFMWTGIDYLGEAHWPARSASAGVLDTCGFEKDSFYFYQSIWKREEPMVHLLPHWNLDVEPGTVIPVLGYTSCDSAELFLNGKSYGRKAYSYPAYGMTEQYGHFDAPPAAVCTDDLFLSWDVPYEPGCIELVGYRDGREAARHMVRTAGESAAVVLEVFGSNLKADGRDVAQISISLVDREGNLCPQAEDNLQIIVEGPATVIGVDNGNPESLESMKTDHIHAFGGKAFAVLRSDGNPGTCRVSVRAEGLAEAEVMLQFN